MNPDSPHHPPPREELEARITAMLLGELSEPDAAALLAQIAADPELAALEARLKPTVDFLRAAAAEPEGEKLQAPEPLQLSQARRDALLWRLRGPAQPLEEKIVAAPFDWRTWGVLAAMVTFLMALISSMFLPSLAKAKSKSARASMASINGLDEQASPSEWSFKPSGSTQLKAHPASEAERGRGLARGDRMEERLAEAPQKAKLSAVAPQKKADASGTVDRFNSPAESGANTRIALPATDFDALTDSTKAPESGVYSVGAVGYVDATPKPAAVPMLGDQPTTGRMFGIGGYGRTGGFGGGVNRVGGGYGGFGENRGYAGNPNGQTAAAPTQTGVNGPANANSFFDRREVGEALVKTDPSTRSLIVISGDETFAKMEAPAIQAGQAPATVVLNDSLAAVPTDKAIETPAALSAQAKDAEAPVTRAPALGSTLNRRVPRGGRASNLSPKPAAPAMVPPPAAQSATARKEEAKIAAGKPLQSAAEDTVALGIQETPAETPAQPSGMMGMGMGMGGAGGGNMSMMYYMSNPELMKRYFPQMYRMMQNGNKNSPEAAKADNAPTEVARRQLSDFETLGRKENLAAQKQEADGRKIDSLDRKKELAQQNEPEIAKVPATPAATPQPEVEVAVNPLSTFSLNVSDVSFKLAAASLEKGQLPDAATIRSEEFINAFDYHDPEPTTGAPVAFAWERARYPFAHDRDMLRFSVKTAAVGRQAGRPLNIVLLLDSSGSMERADRVRIIQECLRVLASQLQPQDRISVVAFARKARLWVDGLEGSKANELVERVGNLTPEGGTNLEEAMNVAYQTALRHFIAGGVNRVVLLTDGAANLGDVQPASLKKKVETERKQGIALDCFGIGWDGLNDDLLEQLSRNGDGRYGFVNTPEAAATEFAGQLAGALKVAASDVKVQVEFNPKRTTAYRQIGYAKHQLTKEQFRDNSVDAAELGAAEAGNALYVVQTNPTGEGPIATVRVRFKIPGTDDYREHEWAVPYEGGAKTLEQSTPAMRLATVASSFSEWLVNSPYAGEVTPDRLQTYLSGVPSNFAADPRPKTLETMIRQAKSLTGK